MPEGICICSRKRAPAVRSFQPAGTCLSRLHSARDFPPEGGAGTKACRVYVESEAAHLCRKNSPASARREIFRQKEAQGRRHTACTSSPKQRTYAGKGSPRLRSARDFPAEEGARTKAYRVYVESEATHLCRKRSASLTWIQKSPSCSDTSYNSPASPPSRTAHASTGPARPRQAYRCCVWP